MKKTIALDRFIRFRILSVFRVKNAFLECINAKPNNMGMPFAICAIKEISAKLSEPRKMVT